MTHKPINTLPELILTILMVIAILIGLMLTYGIEVIGCKVDRLVRG